MNEEETRSRSQSWLSKVILAVSLMTTGQLTNLAIDGLRDQAYESWMQGTNEQREAYLSTPAINPSLLKLSIPFGNLFMNRYEQKLKLLNSN
jgi:hypothetical protein